MDYLGWSLTIIMIVGAIMNARGNRWGFVVWIIDNFGWIAHNMMTGVYAQIPVWVAMNAISVYGFVKWSEGYVSTNKELAL